MHEHNVIGAFLYSKLTVDKNIFCYPHTLRKSEVMYDWLTMTAGKGAVTVCLVFMLWICSCRRRPEHLKCTDTQTHVRAKFSRTWAKCKLLNAKLAKQALFIFLAQFDTVFFKSYMVL